MSGPYAPTDLTQSKPIEQSTESSDAPANWSVPDGLAADTAKAASDELKPTTVDAMAQAADPPKPPEGAPELRPYLRLPFRDRADYMEKLDPLWAKVQALPKQGDEAGPAQAAVMYRTLAEIDDLMRGVAVDPDAYDAWVASVGDGQFMQLFSSYIAGSQPGEAASSPS